MNRFTIAGLASLAGLGAHAQGIPALSPSGSFDPVIVTATRSLTAAPTLRDAIVITRQDLEAAGPISLAEVLQRQAGIEIRSTGGPGQPQTLFIRGAGTAQTLVLVDGLRVGSATVGTTSIENIPLEMIERVEVVKGPLSSLYGPEAMGGVVQIFTRGKSVPHFFASTGYGTDNDGRLSAGLSTSDNGTVLSLSAGVRAVDARSATNPRAGFLYNPDRDPYDNAFFTLRGAQTMWQGETVEIEAFASRGRTHFDSGPGDDRNDQSIAGAKLTSSIHFMPWWASRITFGGGRDRLDIHGSFPGFLETQQQQASWINEFATPLGNLVAGVETVHQHVVSDESTPFTTTRRNTNSAFIGVNESFAGQSVETSVRRDQDDQFGARNTGSVSYGLDWPSVMRIAATYAQGFRAPTFFDLYGPTFPGSYTPNPALEPEQSRGYELSFKAERAAPLQWRITAFDNRFENLIVYSAQQQTVVNVARARARGIEASLDASWKGTRLRASITAQRPRDEVSGARLQGRSELYGTLDASRSFGRWTAGATLVASGDRFDSANETPASRLPGYAVIDARLRYAFDAHWSAQLSATNLFDRRYENAVGYDAPRRAVMLSVGFESY
ncbi:MAG: TonB-dependent receptor plug domain-containing protein [Usitatibacter sp.]